MPRRRQHLGRFGMMLSILKAGCDDILGTSRGTDIVEDLRLYVKNRVMGTSLILLVVVEMLRLNTRNATLIREE